MKHQALASLGVDVAAASLLVESALHGKEGGQILDSQNRITNIFVYPHLSDSLTAPELMALPVPTTTGSHVTLDDVAELNTVEGVARVYREKGERRVAITASPRGRDVVGFVNDVSDRLGRALNLAPGYRMQWDGSFQNASRAAQQLMIVIPVCFFVILLLLRSWFGVWGAALELLWEIPFSLIGGFALLKALGLNLSISAAAGAIVLCGVSFLTGMMILSELGRTGSPFEAVKKRGFGIFISNLVAVVGLIPAATSTGVGAEISRPFAVMIVGGLVSSLILSVLLYPVFLRPRLTSDTSSSAH
jgi:cobalt-zinc-cadmium resistance protein CzcA